jgi:hypothetical protein
MKNYDRFIIKVTRSTKNKNVIKVCFETLCPKTIIFYVWINQKRINEYVLNYLNSKRKEIGHFLLI